MEDRKFLNKGRVVFWCIVVFLCLPFLFSFAVGIDALMEGKQWLLFHSEKCSGRVVEEDTNKPVEGAVVIASWSTWPMVREPHPLLLILYINPLYYIGGSLENVFGSGKLVATSTDKDGRYEVPQWWSFQPWQYSHIGSKDPNMCIYKPGYKTLYTSPLRDFWLMDGKKILPDLNNLPFKKSVTAEELEKDYDDYWMNKTYDFRPSHKDFPKIDNIITQALDDLPAKNTK